MIVQTMLLTLMRLCADFGFSFERGTMKIFTASEFKRRHSEVLSLKKDETLLIKKYGKDACFVFHANTGKRLVLYAYSEGVLSRADTMNLLGIDWYGTLLDELHAEGIALPELSPEVRSKMVQRAMEILGRAKKEDEIKPSSDQI